MPAKVESSNGAFGNVYRGPDGALLLELRQSMMPTRLYTVGPEGELYRPAGFLAPEGFVATDAKQGRGEIVHSVNKGFPLKPDLKKTESGWTFLELPAGYVTIVLEE